MRGQSKVYKSQLISYLVVADMADFLTATLVVTTLTSIPLAVACSSLQQLPSSLPPFTKTVSPLVMGDAAAATTDFVVGSSMESISRAATT